MNAVSENTFDYKYYINSLSEFPKNCNIILGLVRPIYARSWASYWTQNDNSPIIILTIEPNVKSGQLNTGTFICSVFNFPQPLSFKRRLFKIFSKIEIKISKTFYAKSYSILNNFGNQSATYSVYISSLVLPLLRKLRPKKIIAHQALRFGLAASLYKGCPTFIMPYGQDVLVYGKASPFIKAVIGYSLRNVNLVLSPSWKVGKFIATYYKISESKVHSFSGGIDTKYFINKDRKLVTELRDKLGIKNEDIVIFNIRRFQKGWGSEIIIKSFMEMAKLDKKYKFIIVKGGIEFNNSDLKEKLASENILSSFIYYDRSVSLKEYRELLFLSNIGISMVMEGDNRSSSILQAAAAGLPLVLNKDEEFISLKKWGFEALFINNLDKDQIINGLTRLSQDTDLRQKLSLSNIEYVSKYEDSYKQFKKLYSKIGEIIS